jgi:hypothetical protein
MRGMLGLLACDCQLFLNNLAVRDARASPPLSAWSSGAFELSNVSVKRKSAGR